MTEVLYLVGRINLKNQILGDLGTLSETVMRHEIFSFHSERIHVGCVRRKRVGSSETMTNRKIATSQDTGMPPLHCYLPPASTPQN